MKNRDLISFLVFSFLLIFGCIGQIENERVSESVVLNKLNESLNKYLALMPVKNYWYNASNIFESPNGTNNVSIYVWEGRDSKGVIVKGRFATYLLYSNASGNYTCANVSSFYCTDEKQYWDYFFNKREWNVLFLSKARKDDFSTYYFPLINAGVLRDLSFSNASGRSVFVFTYSFKTLPLSVLQEMGVNPINSWVYTYDNFTEMMEFDANNFLVRKTVNLTKGSEVTVQDFIIHEYSLNKSVEGLKPKEEWLNKTMFEAQLKLLEKVSEAWELYKKEGNLTKAVFKKAVEYNLPELCTAMLEGNERDMCYGDFAILKKKEEVCDLIVNETLKERCHDFFNDMGRAANESKEFPQGGVNSS